MRSSDIQASTISLAENKEQDMHLQLERSIAQSDMKQGLCLKDLMTVCCQKHLDNTQTSNVEEYSEARMVN